MRTNINSSTRALILIMIALVFIGILIAKIYYGSVNNSVDPRVVPARQLYSEYDSYAQAGNYYDVFSLLDSIESIYASYPHYRDSYEMGVIYNNRAATLLTIALFGDSIRVDYNPFFGVSGDSVNNLAEINAMKAISIYDEWLIKYKDKSPEEIAQDIRDEFFIEFNQVEEKDKVDFLNVRSEEIFDALLEVDQRLSVCYTNLGVLYRQRGQYEEAVRYYKKALDLWDRNLSAENNLNILFGRPLKKRNIIQKLFPPDRD